MVYMSTAGNQYADKVFSEHPIAMWSLDEKLYYLSLIDDNDRRFSTWTLDNCTYSNTPSIPDTPSPFSSDIYSSITADVSTPVLVDVESSGLFSSVNIDTETNTFCVNFFMYQKPTYINWFKVGYRYLDALGDPQEVLSDEIPPPLAESWVNFNNVYQLPTSWSGDLKLVIQVDFSDSSSGDDSSRTLIMNGLSVGQNSEATCYSSLGSTAISIPSTIGISGVLGVSADQYGVLADNGYYIVRNNQILAHNDGFPIIYGTDHSTKVYPSNVNIPSFVFPGKGMLHEKGRNKQYSLEMWMKLDPSTNIAKRIIGPLDSNDGVYVKEGFLTLVVGDQIASHCVSEWYRPMLMHLIIKENNIVMLINGEEVINILFPRTTIDLPDTADWWGIYSYSTVGVFNIDCISIYPYSISNLVAKRRFVYGQGTPSIQSIDNTFSGTPTTIDFSVAEYSSNIIYPDFGRWDAGYFNNLNATRDYISVPEYQLPIINIGGRDVNEWYADNYTVNTLEYPDSLHPKFITFRPNISYDIDDNPYWNAEGSNYTSQSYLNFTSLNILNDSLSAVYGIFEIEEDIATSRTLMSFVNITNGDTFDINVESDEIKYMYNGSPVIDSNGDPAVQSITLGIEVLVGLNFEAAGIAYGYDVARFFSSPSSVQLYIGGNGTNTFEGKIYIVGFCNQTNYESISSNFDINGIINKDNYEILLDHFASYTLIAEYEYQKMYLDISVSSEWEEYFPLSYFASYVKDEDGNPVYDLDMLQINLGYASVETQDVWQYLQLKEGFSTETYQDLKDSIYTNYFNLKKNNTSGDTINVGGSSLSGHITFQSLASGANDPLSSFYYEKTLTETYVIDPDLENTVLLPEKAYQTKFVFKDNVIVYPPKSNNFEDYAMVVHLSINQRSILKNPLKIKSFEVISKNFNYNSLTQDKAQRNYIGTKFGKKIYPEIENPSGVDYKDKNPYTIYKTNTPYLYNTKKSGIKLSNYGSITSPAENSYRILVPVNDNGSYDFNVSAINFFVLATLPTTDDEFPMMDINYKDGTISLIANKTVDGISVKAYNKVIAGSVITYTETYALSFYQNGKYVNSPSIKNNEWNNISVLFDNSLDFGEFYNGSINIFGGFVFNNISYYLKDGLEAKVDLSIRTWDGILNEDYDGNPITPENIWSYWSSDSKTWQYAYILGQNSSYTTTPQDIYKAYTGTNRNIIDDGYGMQLQQKETSIITDVSWSSYTDKPA
jgi:hypothetical protein